MTTLNFVKTNNITTLKTILKVNDKITLELEIEQELTEREISIIKDVFITRDDFDWKDWLDNKKLYFRQRFDDIFTVADHLMETTHWIGFKYL